MRVPGCKPYLTRWSPVMETASVSFSTIPRMNVPRRVPQKRGTEGLSSGAERLVRPMHQPCASPRLSKRAKLRSRHPHKPTLRQVTLNQPQRQVPPADPREDQSMLRREVAHAPCAGGEHIVVSALRQRRGVLHDDLHMLGEFSHGDEPAVRPLRQRMVPGYHG